MSRELGITAEIGIGARNGIRFDGAAG